MVILGGIPRLQTHPNDWILQRTWDGQEWPFTCAGLRWWFSLIFLATDPLKILAIWWGDSCTRRHSACCDPWILRMIKASVAGLILLIKIWRLMHRLRRSNVSIASHGASRSESWCGSLLLLVCLKIGYPQLIYWLKLPWIGLIPFF